MKSETPANYNPTLLSGGLLHPRRRKPLIFFALTLSLLVISTVAHFSSYLNFNFSTRFPYLWLALHLSILTPFAIYAFYKHQPAFRGPAAYVEESQIATWLTIVLVGASLFYTMINFAYYTWILKYGYPDSVGGQFLLILPHGAKAGVLSAEQFPLYQLYQARKVSGHWMLFHLVPLMDYWDQLTDRVV